jgi:hypothetical protein
MATYIPTQDTVVQPKRPTTSFSSLPELSKPFILDSASRSYKHQYANIYFVRLVELRPIVEERAMERWKGVKGGSDRGSYTKRLSPCVSVNHPRLIAVRQTAAPATDPQPATESALLYRRDSVYGYASQAKRPGRHGKRCMTSLCLYE